MGRWCVRVENQLWRARTSSGPERRQPPETQQFDLYHPMAPLPRSDKLPFLPHVHTTGLHSLFLYSDTPPPCHTTIRLARAIFAPNLCPYKHPNNLIPVILPAYVAHQDGTECNGC